MERFAERRTLIVPTFGAVNIIQKKGSPEPCVDAVYLVWGSRT